MAIGTMPMPADFKYKDLYLAGRPKHEKFDEFWCKHPPMDCGKRAKIFKPFAALGFCVGLSVVQRIACRTGDLLQPIRSSCLFQDY